MSNTHEEFMRRAIEIAGEGIASNEGGPFGAVVVRDGEIIGEGSNRVTSSNDPTAHAEIVAIRMACETIGSFQLENCAIYSTCEPCPMCLGAIYWARPEMLFIACTREDAAESGFDDEMIYEELANPPDKRRIRMVSLMRDEAAELFRAWDEKPDKIEY